MDAVNLILVFTAIAVFAYVADNFLDTTTVQDLVLGGIASGCFGYLLGKIING